MPEEKPEEPKTEKKKKLPVNFMVDEFAEQQNITLDKLKEGEKKDANDADANGSTN